MAYDGSDHSRGRDQSRSMYDWRGAPSHDSYSPSRSRTGSGASDLESSSTHTDTPSSAPQLQPSMPFFLSKRHITCGNPMHTERQTASWRLNSRTLRTSQAALILCLNIGCDPPDVVKTQPGAVLECWVDPYSMPPSKALDAIGRNLQRQFENLNPRGKYKSYLDPSVDDFKSYMQNLRTRTKEERALVYYNGHGVPKPTSNGEFWVFNRNYTQYIPVSLNDFQEWIEAPSIFVWDCSAAGNILQNYIKFAQPKDEGTRSLYPDGNFPEKYAPLMDCIQLLACGADETLPMAPDLPADVFTSCLTSPIEMALRYFVLQNRLQNPDVTLDMVMRIPGDLKDRRTPLGELHWIFTAVTDTIAWSTFPHDIFRRLFRQDLMTASLFRNFLLAERIMRNYDCTPLSYPALPATHTHPMWNAWDLAVDACLAQLPHVLRSIPAPLDPTMSSETPTAGTAPTSPPPTFDYTPSTFFAEHLTAFEVWLSRGGSAATTEGPRSRLRRSSSREASANGFIGGLDPSPSLVPRRPPDQLPILLQVLLSQAHRLRALILLSQFVDLGPWAVHLALEIGIFPYVQRLLQSPAPDVKPVLIFIWARIFAIDQSCQRDILRENGYEYFAKILAPQNPSSLIIPNASEHRAMCAYILSVVARDHTEGQDKLFAFGVFDSCLHRLDDDDFLLRQWSALCIAQLWDAKDDIKAYGMEHSTHDKLMEMLHDVSPEVRAAAMYALGIFLGASGSSSDTRKGGGGTGGLLPFELRDQFRVEVAVGTRAMLAGRDDASPLVRKELLVLLSALVVEWRGWFVIAAWIYWEWDKGNRVRNENTMKGQVFKVDNPEDSDAISLHRTIAEWIRLTTAADPRATRDFNHIREENRVLLSSFFTILSALFDLSVDPYPEVATMARIIVDYIMALLVESAFARLPSSTLNQFPRRPSEDESSPISHVGSPRSPSPFPRSRRPSLHVIPLNSAASPAQYSTPPYRRGSLQRTDSMLSSSAISGAVISVPHGNENLPPVPVVPEPHLNLMSYVSPWNSNAQFRSLPTPSPPEPLHKSPQNPGVALSPSWSSLSPPPSTFAPSTLVFPKKERVRNDNVRPNGPKAKRTGFTPVDIFAAFVEEDLERQRARQSPYADEFPAYGRGVDHHRTSNPALALGHPETIADILPFRSTFFDSSAEYYSEPQMRQAEVDEPGSESYNEQMFKRRNNERMVTETFQNAREAGTLAWDKPVTSINNEMDVSHIIFHPTDTHLLAADDTNIITVWDWARKKRLNVFSNSNPVGTNITSLNFINEELQSMVLVGSADEIVRVYRNYENDRSPMELVTSFRALNDRIKVKRGSGMVLDWQQSNGILLASGDVRIVRVWDAHRELCLQDIPTHAASSVTSLASEADAGELFAVGHADGSLHIFDRRLRSGAVLRSCEGHQSWIQKVHWQSNGNRDLISASVDGTMCIWDVRSSVPTLIMNPQPRGLANLAIHDEANVFATTSAITPTLWRQQTMTVEALPYRFSVNPPSPALSRIVQQTGLYNPPSITHTPGTPALAFHPHEMIVASGSLDGTIRLYGTNLDNKTLSFELPLTLPSMMTDSS